MLLSCYSPALAACSANLRTHCNTHFNCIQSLQMPPIARITPAATIALPRLPLPPPAPLLPVCPCSFACFPSALFTHARQLACAPDRCVQVADLASDGCLRREAGGDAGAGASPQLQRFAGLLQNLIDKGNTFAGWGPRREGAKERGPRLPLENAACCQGGTCWAESPPVPQPAA